MLRITVKHSRGIDTGFLIGVRTYRTQWGGFHILAACGVAMLEAGYRAEVRDDCGNVLNAIGNSFCVSWWPCLHNADGGSYLKYAWHKQWAITTKYEQMEKG